jgi:nitrite reductase/ring-hydroxylating ferredoxin subunit
VARVAEASQAERRWVVIEGALPEPGGLRAVEVAGRAVLLCNVAGEAYAIEDRCPHVETPLRDGRLEGAVLECPLHGGRLDVRDGSAVALPIRRSAESFPVRLDGARVEIGLPSGG